MTDTRHANHGVNTDELGEFAEYAAENPDAVQLGHGARSTYEGICARSLAKTDSYTLGDGTTARETREYIELTVDTPKEVRAGD